MSPARVCTSSVVVLLGRALALGLLATVTGCHTAITPAVDPTPSGPRSPGPTSAAAPAGWSELSRAVERVDAQRSVFRLRDSAGDSMETLKVVPYPHGYLGVYHHRSGRTFEVRVATSTNLRVWHYWSRLDPHASQPTLVPLRGGGYLLAVEADKGGRPGPGKRWLRFRYYTDLQHLLSGQSRRSFDAPHTLTAPDRGAEGTPNIYSATLRGDVADSEFSVGFHYLRAGVDREARGVLTNFSTWTTSPDRALDRALDRGGMRGKHGDRDCLQLNGRQFCLVEAQNGSDALWRIALVEAGRRRHLRRLGITTPGRSRSFANPTLVRAVLPDGRPGLVVTLYLPVTGAAPGEAGQLLYYNRL
jgi:hypothetical protein